MNLIVLLKDLHSNEIDRIIEMAWEDRTPFSAIEFQFNIKEKEVIHLMRSNLRASSFKLWRERVSGRKTKLGFQKKKDLRRQIKSENKICKELSKV